MHPVLYTPTILTLNKFLFVIYLVGFLASSVLFQNEMKQILKHKYFSRMK